jgi:hypothetical protein
MGSDRRGGQLALVIFVACVRLRLSTPDNHHRDPLLVVWRPAGDHVKLASTYAHSERHRDSAGR